MVDLTKFLDIIVWVTILIPWHYPETWILMSSETASETLTEQLLLNYTLSPHLLLLLLWSTAFSTSSWKARNWILCNPAEYGTNWCIHLSNSYDCINGPVTSKSRCAVDQDSHIDKDKWSLILEPTMEQSHTLGLLKVGFPFCISLLWFYRTHVQTELLLLGGKSWLLQEYWREHRKIYKRHSQMYLFVLIQQCEELLEHNHDWMFPHQKEPLVKNLRRCIQSIVLTFFWQLSYYRKGFNLNTGNKDPFVVAEEP